MKDIKVIAFDADDTLWENETFFREAEHQLCVLLAEYGEEKAIVDLLLDHEVKNIPLYGFGVKNFILSAIETAMEASDYQVPNTIVKQIMELGNDILRKPVVLLEDVKEVLPGFARDYKLVLATKGDLLDQQRKLQRSGLTGFFDFVEVMSDKKADNYEALLKRLDVKASEFLMVGNSLKSDILPVLELGGKAVHIPFHTTWAHELVSEKELEGKEFIQLNSFGELPGVIAAGVKE
ncbi:MAG: HAD family hydrolase [Bacteroidales bacterium]